MNKSRFVVRLMSPLGLYPPKSFVTEDDALIVSPDVCFTIAKVLGDDWASEVDCLGPSELPLLASFLLAGEAGTLYVYPYPTAISVQLEIDQPNAKITDILVSECRTRLLDSLGKVDNDYSSDAFHLPPILGGRQYSFVEDQNVEQDQLHVLRRLENADKVILRGVNCLLKGRMAFKHFEFGEAACIYLWIALDAAHSLVLRILRASGIPEPTSADAARYFEKLSGLGSHWDKFFEEDYENRIRAIHPDNRFGAESIPLLLADDFLELNDDLIPLFRHLIDAAPAPLERHDDE